VTPAAMARAACAAPASAPDMNAKYINRCHICVQQMSYLCRHDTVTIAVTARSVQISAGIRQPSCTVSKTEVTASSQLRRNSSTKPRRWPPSDTAHPAVRALFGWRICFRLPLQGQSQLQVTGSGAVAADVAVAIAFGRQACMIVNAGMFHAGSHQKYVPIVAQSAQMLSKTGVAACI